MKTDLSYLKSMSSDNHELIHEMIDIFTVQVDEFNGEFQHLLDEGNYEALGKLAHKAKSSVAIMGMEDLAGMLKEFEILAKDGRKPEKYQGYVDRFISECREAVRELELYKKKMAEQ